MQTIARGEAKAEYKRNKTLAKIQEKRKNLESIQAQKAAIAAERMKLREEIDRSKLSVV